MDYTKVTFRIEKAEEYTQDILIAYLADAGFESFEETTQGVIGYCPTSLFNEATMLQAIDDVPGEATIQYRMDEIADQNWNAEWEKNHFEPIDIEGRCCIHNQKKCPEKPYEYDIVINPCQSFGTGSHETTRLIVGMLMQLDLNGKRVIDMGCGTGVLSIMAEKRGAQHITAIDIDPWSQRNCEENVKSNDCQHIETLLGDAQQLAGKTCDLFLANINRNILLNDMERYNSCLKRNGELILSGFFSEDLPVLIEKATQLGFTLLEQKENNNWVAAHFVKN